MARKPVQIVVLVAAAFFMSGFFWSSPETEVRNSSIPGTKATLGQVLEGYKYGLNPEWSVQEAKDGTKLVVFKSAYNGAAVAESIALENKKNLSQNALEYLSKLPPQLYIMGLFATRDGKISESIIQIADKSQKICVPMSLPIEIFIKNKPIPSTFIPEEAEVYYNYQLTKFLFSSVYKDGFNIYSLYAPNVAYSERLPIRININAINYDDQKFQIGLRGNLSLLALPITIKNETINGNRIYMVNNQKINDEKIFDDLLTYGMKLNTLVPEVSNAKPIESINIELIRNFASSKSFDDIQNEALRAVCNITSYEPFTCHWQLMFFNDLTSLLNSEGKAYIKHWERLQKNWLRKKASTAHNFGRGTQIIIYENSHQGGGSGSVLLQPNTNYRLGIHYDENHPDESEFNLTVNDSCNIHGICKNRGDYLLCEYNDSVSGSHQKIEIPSLDFFELSKLYICGKEHNYISFGFKNVIEGTGKSDIKKSTSQIPAVDGKTEESKRSASKDELVPGMYLGKNKNDEIVLNLYLDGTGTYTEDDIPISWTTESKNINLMYQNDENNKNIVEHGNILSNTSFVMKESRINFVLNEGTKPVTYSYSKSGFSGDLIIQPPLDTYSDNRVCIEINTTNQSTSKKCHTYAWCDKEAKEIEFLECQSNTNESGETLNFTLKFPNDSDALIEGISKPSVICDPTGEFGGIYKLQER